MNSDVVSVVKLDCYDEKKVDFAVRELVSKIDDFSWVKPQMNIVIKVNLVSAMKPEEAGTTNPFVVKALCKILTEKQANVVVGDSPGGIFTSAFVNNIYKQTQMTIIEQTGAKLNQDFSQSTVKNESGEVCKVIDSCNYLLNADAIINISKLKTHGMMAMSACVKNMFGTIGGTLKPEYHFRYPEVENFASMLIDLNEFYKCKLNIVDAVVGMEGNGPTQGTPRFIGALLASKNPYNLDLVCAKLIGLNVNNVPTLQIAFKRNLSPESADEVKVTNSIDDLVLKDYNLIKKLNGLEFQNQLKGMWGKIFAIVAKKSLQSKPKVKKSECVGCKKCFNICPAKAITMKNNTPLIDRKKCIRCFCCQEFCPKGAMKVSRPIVAKLLNKK